MNPLLIALAAIGAIGLIVAFAATRQERRPGRHSHPLRQASLGLLEDAMGRVQQNGSSDEKESA